MYNLIFVLLIICFNQALCQNTIVLRGKVLTHGSKEAVSFASIAVSGTTMGTACNEFGNFELAIPIKFNQIKVSCIGYVSKMVPVDSLRNIKEVVIFLKPDKTLLSELTVTSSMPEPTEILRDALKKVPENYCTKPFNIEAFSTIRFLDSLASASSFTLETVFLGYYDGYKNRGLKKFELTQKREFGKDPLRGQKYKYWPSVEMYSVDLITDQFAKGIFNEENWPKFKFSPQSIKLYESDTVFVIDYSLPNPNEKITGYGTVPKYYRGTIYIAANNSAVVRHTLETSSFKMDIIYRKISGEYFPYLIQGTRENEFKVDGKKRTVRIKNSIMVTNIMLTDVKRIDMKANEWETGAVKFDKQYWDSHYPR